MLILRLADRARNLLILQKAKHLGMLHVGVSHLWVAFFSLAASFFVSQGAQVVEANLQSEVDQVKERAQLTYTIDRPQAYLPPDERIAPLGCVIEPFGFTPNWGTMQTSQIHRSFCAMRPEEFISPPSYDLSVLTRPIAELERAPRTSDTAHALTSKLFYSTRYLGTYDLDSGEFVTTDHPAIDFKMPKDTPVRAIANGKIHAVRNDPDGLGKHIIIQHRMPETGSKVFSIYGHLDQTIVVQGQNIAVGEYIGTVGSTGKSTHPHLHLQIDKDRGGDVHTPYVPGEDATRAEIARWTLHPIDFIEFQQTRLTAQ